MAPVTAAIQQRYQGRIVFTVVDVRDKDKAALWDRYQVQGTPTYLILDGQGREAARIVGSGHRLEEFAAVLKRLGVR